MRTKQFQSACWMMLVCLPVLYATFEQPAVRADGDAMNAADKRGRHVLPKYYAKVITEAQRAKIYAIQDQYDPKIDALAAQLKALKAQRDEKVKAVLTPEQQKQVEDATAKAKKKPAK
jgi:Spy/CpxP family protein refolding chaperone